MADPREPILARLAEILAGLSEFSTAYRNAVMTDDDALPAIMLLDGDEEAIEADTVGKSNPRAPSRVVMSPRVLIKISDQEEAVGPALNALRTVVVRAILTDDGLKDAVGANGQVRYVSTVTGLEPGRGMLAEAALTFAITYPLVPNTL